PRLTTNGRRRLATSIVHVDDDRRDGAGNRETRVASLLAAAWQIGHLASVTLVEPLVEGVSSLGGSERADANEVEAEAECLGLDARLQGQANRRGHLRTAHRA